MSTAELSRVGAIIAPEATIVTSPNDELAERFSRHSGIVDPAELPPCTVIGVGAVGRNVALQLASLGVSQLQLIDFDEIELSNVATQGYRTEQIGQKKVEATAADAMMIYPDMEITVIDDRIRPKHGIHPAVFCCVDKISTRELIWNTRKHESEFFVDGRMRGWLMRILAVGKQEDHEAYEKSFFEQTEAEEGACTARGTIFTATIAAGLMVNQLAKWTRKFNVDKDTIVNLLENSMYFGGD